MGSVLIAGGAGFLGSHLCDLFWQRNFEVICVDNLITGRHDNIQHLLHSERFTYMNHDVTRPLEIEQDLDYVLNFASPASPPDYYGLPIQTMLVGSIGTHNLLELAKDKSSVFMMASTSEVYGDPIVSPQPESYWGNVNPIGLRSCYDEGKRCAESLFINYQKEHDLKIKIVRIFNTYGPRMLPHDGRVVSNLIMQGLKKENMTLYGDGTQTRS